MLLCYIMDNGVTKQNQLWLSPEFGLEYGFFLINFTYFYLKSEIFTVKNIIVPKFNIKINFWP